MIYKFLSFCPRPCICFIMIIQRNFSSISSLQQSDLMVNAPNIVMSKRFSNLKRTHTDTRTIKYTTLLKFRSQKQQNQIEKNTLHYHERLYVWQIPLRHFRCVPAFQGWQPFLPILHSSTLDVSCGLTIGGNVVVGGILAKLCEIRLHSNNKKNRLIIAVNVALNVSQATLVPCFECYLYVGPTKVRKSHGQQ